MNNSFTRWGDKPNSWPTGMECRRPKYGIIGAILGISEKGIVGDYTYMSGSTEVPIKWDRGKVTWHHISEIPGALD